MGNAASIFDCSVNPLNPSAGDNDHLEEDGEASGPLLLEPATPLRDSLLWRLQSTFYAQLGARAWTDGIVPNFVTSNSFVARSYTRIILGFLRDIATAERSAAAAGFDLGTATSQPVCIIEVGAGHGKLAYLLVESLLRFRAFFPSLGGLPPDCLPFRYIVTDPVPEALAAVRAHPALQDWLAAGVIDTAVYDAEGEVGPLGLSLTLQGCGQVLYPTSLARPPVFIASYVLDSLRTDAVRVLPGGAGVEQACVSLVTPRSVDGAAALSHDMLGRVGLRWSYTPLRLGGEVGEEGADVPVPRHEEGAPPDLFESEPYASSLPLRSLVRTYAATPSLARSTLLIPTAAATLVDRLHALAGGRMLLLVGDKGYAYTREMEGPPPPPLGPLPGSPALPKPVSGDPHVALHGSFSLMVNFHALRSLAAAYGATVVGTPWVEGYKTAALLFGSPDPREGGGAGQEAAFSSPHLSAGSARVVAAREGAPLVTRPLPRTAASALSPPEGTEAVLAALVAVGGRALPPTAGCAGASLPLYALRTRPLPPSATPTGFDASFDELELDRDAAPSPAAAKAWPSALSAASVSLHGFSPEDFAVLQRGVKEAAPPQGLSLRGSLSLLRLSGHDSEVFLKLRGAIIDKGAIGQGGEATPALCRDLRGDVDRVYAGHYSLAGGAAKDVCFDLGRILMGQREYGTAIALFRASNEHVGVHHVTWHNIGCCAYYSGDGEGAALCFTESLKLKPDYAEARQWLEKVAEGRLAAAPVREGAEGAEGVGEGAE
jgi:hypothetical protein